MIFTVDTNGTESQSRNDPLKTLQCFVLKMSVSNMSCYTFSVVVMLLFYVFTFHIKVLIQKYMAFGIKSRFFREGTLVFLWFWFWARGCFSQYKCSGSRGTHLHRALIYRLIMRVSHLDQFAQNARKGFFKLISQFTPNNSVCFLWHLGYSSWFLVKLVKVTDQLLSIHSRRYCSAPAFLVASRFCNKLSARCVWCFTLRSVASHGKRRLESGHQLTLTCF